MGKAILLAIAASFCTATSSVCQRLGARQAGPSAGFDIGLIFRLARRPVWLLGIASMIAGFLLQVTALRYGPLALVQPILALELIFVFGWRRWPCWWPASPRSATAIWSSVSTAHRDGRGPRPRRGNKVSEPGGYPLAGPRPGTESWR
jgi:drug/metabolite transporter (DMT)-like permease